MNPQGNGYELEMRRECSVWNSYKVKVDLRNRSESVSKHCVLVGSFKECLKE